MKLLGECVVFTNSIIYMTQPSIGKGHDRTIHFPQMRRQSSAIAVHDLSQSDVNLQLRFRPAAICWP